MLTSADLTSMRAEMTASFPDTATIRRNNPTSDGQGGQRDSWADAGTAACRLLPANPGEPLEGGRIVAVTDWVALLPHGTSVTAKDRLRVGGVDYEILGTDSASSEPVMLELRVRRLD